LQLIGGVDELSVNFRQFILMFNFLLEVGLEHHPRGGRGFKLELEIPVAVTVP